MSKYWLWIAAAATSLFVCGVSLSVWAHPKRVGIVQAQARAGDPQVAVLFKLEVRALVDALETGSAGRAAPSLTTRRGRAQVVALLDRTHELTSLSGACTQRRVDRYGLTPSGDWLDVQFTYHCPQPVEYIAVRVEVLLGEGHRIDGHLDAGGGVQKVVYTRRAHTHFLLFED